MRGKASVEIAKRLLEGLGYKVLRESVPVMVEGTQVGEVDLLVEDATGLHAVEVKAGKVSVSDVRQAKINAELLGAAPLIIARGFSDKSAEALASKLNVDVLLLSDLYAVDGEELFYVVKAAVEEAITELVSTLSVLEDPTALRVLEAVAASEDLRSAAELLQIEPRKLESTIGDMRRRGLLPPVTGYRRLRAYCQAILAILKLGKKSIG